MVFLVAEIGVNWDGNIELASNMMQSAKNIGFDAVKFQSFNESIIGEHPEKNRLLKSSITKYNIEYIAAAAKSVGIEWFCTPMFPEAVDLLDPYVSRFKIRVADGKPLLQNKTSELLEKIFETNKEVIVSSQSTPKDTKSLKESSSAPKFDPLFSFLANQPSKKSNIVANKIKYIAISQSPFNENLIDVNPLLNESNVIMFGTYLLIIFFSLILI